MDPVEKIMKLIRRDSRYKFEAYAFVFEALRYAQEELGLGIDQEADDYSSEGSEGKQTKRAQRHLTGQELCEAIRLYSLDQFGYMAKCVLNSWGVTQTGDFGEIVYNLIKIGEMHKTPDDRREDFDDVYDFEDGLTRRFQITMPE